LMIALHDPAKSTGAEAVISEFITRGLSRAAENTDGIGPSDFRDALFKLSSKMLSYRVLVPKWSDLRRWLHDDDHSLRALGILASRRTLISRLPSGDDDALTFRHDRVKDHLLADAIARLDAEANRTHPHGDLWLERFERRGESARRGLTVALEWLQQRRTLRALKLTADILVSAGTRAELSSLQIDDITPASEVHEIIADAKFALFRRTLS
jgi:hypothetical protein